MFGRNDPPTPPPACPGWPSSCLLSGDSVQPTAGRVRGAQRDQLPRPVPTQNPPQRERTVKVWGLVDVGGWGGLGCTHHAWLLLRERRERGEEAPREVRLQFRGASGAASKRSRRLAAETKSGRGVAASLTPTPVWSFLGE